jgi:hypothetical protein
MITTFGIHCAPKGACWCTMSCAACQSCWERGRNYFTDLAKNQTGTISHPPKKSHERAARHFQICKLLREGKTVVTFLDGSKSKMPGEPMDLRLAVGPQVGWKMGIIPETANDLTSRDDPNRLDDLAEHLKHSSSLGKRIRLDEIETIIFDSRFFQKAFLCWAEGAKNWAYRDVSEILPALAISEDIRSDFNLSELIYQPLDPKFDDGTAVALEVLSGDVARTGNTMLAAYLAIYNLYEVAVIDYLGFFFTGNDKKHRIAIKFKIEDDDQFTIVFGVHTTDSGYMVGARGAETKISEKDFREIRQGLGLSASASVQENPAACIVTKESGRDLLFVALAAARTNDPSEFLKIMLKLPSQLVKLKALEEGVINSISNEWLLKHDDSELSCKQMRILASSSQRRLQALQFLRFPAAVSGYPHVSQDLPPQSQSYDATVASPNLRGDSNGVSSGPAVVPTGPGLSTPEGINCQGPVRTRPEPDSTALQPVGPCTTSKTVREGQTSNVRKCLNLGNQSLLDDLASRQVVAPEIMGACHRRSRDDTGGYLEALMKAPAQTARGPASAPSETFQVLEMN